MKKHIFNTIKQLAVLTLILGLFSTPATASADWTDIFGGIFGGGNSNYSNSYENYDYTAQQNQGDLELSKRVRVVGQDSKYHEQRQVYSGTLVEIWIEVKNKSRYATQVVVTDELGGSTVYKAGSLSINGVATTKRGLTSGGLVLDIPAKDRSVITYLMYVCSGSNYAIRASAYAAGIGSATDAVIISTEYDYTPYGSYNHVGTCLNQQQNSTNTTSTGYSGPPITSQTTNPFGDWTGVNNSTATNPTASNPFSGWTGVNNSTPTTTTTTTSVATSNPFGDWSGVNNSAQTAYTANTVNNPFAGWTGVNNADAGAMGTMTTNTATVNSTNSAFGDWTGVNNSDTTSNPFGDWYGSSRPSTNSDPFGTWKGVNNSDSVANPFGDWTGVDNSNNSLASNSQGYTDGQSTNTRSTPRQVAAVSTQTTNFVAPTTGVSKTTPVLFAAMLTAGFLIYRKRKLIFN